MTPSPLTRPEFEQLLAEHGRLIRLTNELEYHLYQIGAEPTPEHIAACQQTAGALIGQLRSTLFRHDQRILPTLEAHLPPEAEPLLPCSAG
jgi:hypothetical protein